MILVTLGTNEQCFDRLVRAARTLPAESGLVVQYGSSHEAHGAGEWVDFLSFDELADAMRKAKVVVSHAGAGSMLLARQCGHKPIVVPRLVARGEAVDDHQLHFARRVAALGFVTLVEDEQDLCDVVIEALDQSHDWGTATSHGPIGRLAADLAGFLSSVNTRRREGPPPVSVSAGL
jgi:exopolysaccharide biosynthesis glucuronosyltransferase PssE